MNGCATAAAITALACSIAEGRELCEVQMLAVIFNQLGDTLATIATQRECCCQRNTPSSPDISLK